MKNKSIRFKMTLWFSVILILVVAVVYICVLSVSHAIIQKTIRDNLIETVEGNVDEVEFYQQLNDRQLNYSRDLYLSYNGGYLEIDDDFLNQVNSITTSLYTGDGTLIYGENPIARYTAQYSFSDTRLQTANVNGQVYYIFHRQLKNNGLDGLWLRGIVSQQQGDVQIFSEMQLLFILLPFIIVLDILGGYWIAGKALKPVKDISKAATEISSGSDLKKRIELGQGNDEIHQLANTFNDMFTRLEQSFNTERQFTSDVSHELRTPMSVIMAQCQLALEEPGSTEDYIEALEVIKRQGGKMSAMIDDMLTFARLEQKRHYALEENIDLSEIVQTICEDMALLKTNGIELSCQAEDYIKINGNSQLLSRMLVNLISNAYRYGRENGYIHVELKEDHDSILLLVEDNGIGIEPSKQDKIFNRFYQVDASRTTTGTGLGLSMVASIAKFHGGEVQVKSQLGEGSIFTVKFYK